MKILVTGGTVFVSKFVATYFNANGYDTYVLNRGTRKQVDGVTLIKCDRGCLGDKLAGKHFDAIIDVCAYNQQHISDLLNSGVKFDDYIFISSSAVYPETLSQPFNEKQIIGPNSIWGEYGINKVNAEKYLLEKVPDAYILRPPYLYGPMQNLYREPFVFECAEKNRKFYIPKDGNMKLQFFHVEDLCRVIEVILKNHTTSHVINVGNNTSVSINTFVELCYRVVGKPLEKVYIKNHHNQRDYFSFYDYEYSLDVSVLNKILPKQIGLFEGLKQSYQWYKNNKNEVIIKPYSNYIDINFDY